MRRWWGRRAYDRISGFWNWSVSPITGDDGRPSWAKIITAYVITIYIFTPNLPASVAITAIVAAHGAKMLMLWINRFNPRLELEAEREVLTQDVAEEAAAILEGKPVSFGGSSQ